MTCGRFIVRQNLSTFKSMSLDFKRDEKLIENALEKVNIRHYIYFWGTTNAYKNEQNCISINLNPKIYASEVSNENSFQIENSNSK